MKRARTHHPRTHDHVSRPFFSKGSQGREAAPFFSVPTSAPVANVQYKREVGDQQEPEELQAQAHDSDIESTQYTTDEAPLPPSEPNSKPTIQTKLTISQPNDSYEQEADRIAEQITQIPESDSVIGRIENPPEHRSMQQICAECEDQLQLQPAEEKAEKKVFQISGQITPLAQSQNELKEKEEDIQTKPLGSQFTSDIQRRIEPTGNGEEENIQAKESSSQSLDVSTALETRLNLKQAGGQPLPEKTRGFMESRFGHTFNQVRVHTNAEAAQISRTLKAQAFTHGHNVFFGAGKYEPESIKGKRLLAHELTHVIQQTGSHSNERNTIHPIQSLQTTNIKGNVGLGTIQRDPDDETISDLGISENHIPEDSGIPDEESTNANIEWPQAQRLNLRWWQRFNLIEVLPIHDYDPVHQPIVWANRVFAAQEIMRGAGIRQVENRRLVIDGVLGPRTLLALRQVARAAAHPAKTPLQTLGFNLDAIAQAESAELAALAITRPAEFLLEWDFNPLGERAVRFYDLNYAMVVTDRDLMDTLLFGGEAPEGIRREDRIELLRCIYGQEGHRLQGRIALVHADRPFIHPIIDVQRAIARDRDAPSSILFRFVAITRTRALAILELFEQHEAYLTAYRAAPEDTQIAVVEANALLSPQAQGAPSRSERAAFIFLIYLPALAPDARTALVSRYIVEKAQREREEEAARQAHNREAARQRAEALIQMMDNEETSVRFDVARKSEFPKKNSWLVSKPVPARRSVWSNPGVSQLEG